MKRLLLTVWMAFILISAGLAAQEAHSEQDDLDGLLGGFDSDEAVDIIVEDQQDVSGSAENSEKPGTAADFQASVSVRHESPVTLDGRIWTKTGWAYAFEEDEKIPFDRSGLSSLIGGVYLHGSIDMGENWYGEVSARGYIDFAYMINGWDEYESEQIEDFRQEAVLQEAFIDGLIFPDWRIRAGRQILSLGKIDRLQVLDRLNPLDLREPGLQEINDLKLPVGCLKLGYENRGFSLNGVVVPELRQAQMPVYGSEFYQAGSTEVTDLWPDSGMEENEYFLSADLIAGGWDFSVVYGYYLWDIPRIEVSGGGSLFRVYDRVHSAGAAAETVIGPVVLALEGAWIHGFGFQGDPENDYSRIDLAGGINWNAPFEVDLSAEVCSRRYFDLDEEIILLWETAEVSSWEYALNLSRRFFHERLNLSLAAMVLGLKAENGGIIRLDSEWELADGLKAKLTWADYLEGDSGMLAGAGDNDRLVFTVTRSF